MNPLRALTFDVAALLLSLLTAWLGSRAASAAPAFDCEHALTFAARTVCASPRLTALDEAVTREFLRNLERVEDPGRLHHEQNKWLQEERDACPNEACLEQAYLARRQRLANYPKGLGREACVLPGLTLPADFAVLAATANLRSPRPHQIDASGNSADEIDVVVNHPTQPVVLFLLGDRPTIWKLRRTAATRLLLVIADGPYRQGIAGLEPDIPTFANSQVMRMQCGIVAYGYLNPIARHLFGRQVKMAYRNRDAEIPSITIGDTPPADATFVTSDATRPESFYDKEMPLAGQSGLDLALAKALVRKATEDDIRAWNEAAAERLLRAKPGQQRKVSPPNVGSAYVVLKLAVLPSDLRDVEFIVPRGEPVPAGRSYLTTIYNLNDVTCSGSGCNRTRVDIVVEHGVPR